MVFWFYVVFAGFTVAKQTVAYSLMEEQHNGFQVFMVFVVLAGFTVAKQTVTQCGGRTA